MFVNKTINNFTNNKYKLLNLMLKNQIVVNNDEYVPLSQDEIIKELHISKQSLNGLLKELISLNCIINYKQKYGKYAVTQKGKEIIQKIGGINI